MAPRTIALAVDGMEPTLLDRWIAAGELPNLAERLERGVGGTASCSSLSSAKQWTTHFTGVDPERHGVSGFTTTAGSRRAGDDAPDAKELINVSDIGVQTYPELLAERGVGVGLVNPLPLWPPLELDGGFCVSGMLTPPASDRWTYPPALADALDARDYRIDVRYGDRPYGFVDDALFEAVDLATLHEDFFDVLDARIAVTKALLAGEFDDGFQAAFDDTRADPDVDLLYVLLKSIDVIQHCFWAHMAADDPTYGDAILESYRRVDDLVGWLDDETEANLLVFSDHGFGPRREAASSNLGRLARAVDERVPVPGAVERLYGRLFKSEATVSLDNPGKTTGDHADPAVWVLDGPDVATDRDRVTTATRAPDTVADGDRVDGVAAATGDAAIRFEDVTASLLALLDEPVPEAYVGDPVPWVSTEPGRVDVDLSVRRRTDLADHEVVSERLHNLGYAEMVDEE